MVKGVIFDFNGVIVDDYPIQKEAWSYISQILRNKGVTDREMIENIRGVPTADTIMWLSEGALPTERLQELSSKKISYVNELYASSPLFCLNSGLLEFLNQIKENGMARTIATSSTYEDMKFAFEKLGLKRWFDIQNIVYNDGTYRGKPAPDAYLLAAKKINLPIKSCVVFEDAVSGIKSARAAGCEKIVVVNIAENLPKIVHLPGVVLGIESFKEINYQTLLKM